MLFYGAWRRFSCRLRQQRWRWRCRCQRRYRQRIISRPRLGRWLDYTYLDNGETGKTGERGAFSFPKGQTVAFSIGEVDLGDFVSNAERDFVTPTRIVDSGTNAIRDAVRIERLLIALDSAATVNGTIILDAQSAADATVVWNALTVDGAAMTAFPLAAGETGGVTVARMIPSVDDATRFLTNTNNCAFSGAFEGTWTNTNDDTTGDVALVLLAFNEGALSISNSLGTVRGADQKLNEITGENPTASGAVYVNLWKEGGSSETPVMNFGSSYGLLPINLGTFPVVQTIPTADVFGGVITLTVESYNRMTYTSAQETGVYRRVKEEVQDADYRIAGFYSDANNGDNPPEAEIGIYAFSANAGGGSVEPYVGWFSSPLGGTEVYSNIGEVRTSSPISYTWTSGPELVIDDDDGTAVDGMMVITDDSDRITVSFTHDTRMVQDRNGNNVLASNGYGTFEDVSAGREILGGWCAL